MVSGTFLDRSAWHQHGKLYVLVTRLCYWIMLLYHVPGASPREKNCAEKFIFNQMHIPFVNLIDRSTLVYIYIYIYIYWAEGFQVLRTMGGTRGGIILSLVDVL